MTVPLYAPVRLLTNAYLAEGVCRGDIGTVLEDFGNALLVEFSRPDGTTIAWFPVQPDEVQPVAENPAVRRTG